MTPVTGDGQFAGFAPRGAGLPLFMPAHIALPHKMSIWIK